MHETLIAIALLAVAIWFWRESLQAREAATLAGRGICKANEVQFLDETVALARMSLGWNGRVALLRSYRFDYSTDGADRATGLVVVQGRAIVHVQLHAPGTLH